MVGCSNGSLTVELYSNEIEYGSIESACELVSTINGTKVDSSIENDAFEFEGEFVTCSRNDFRVLGDHIVSYEYKKLRYEKRVTVVDKTAPIIHIDEGIFKVEEGNQYFDVLNQVSITDNADLSPKVSIDGNYDLQIPGTYQIKIVAVDANGNKSEQAVAIEVVKKEVLTVTQEVIVKVPIKNNNKPVDKPDKKPPVGGNTKPSAKAPANKKFLFVDGYTIKTGHEACYDYIKNYTQFQRSCQPLFRGEVGIGYEAIFK